MITARPSLRDRKKDATRQAIEDAAWDLFSRQGYDATTVHQIAEAADVAPRTFFRYFPSKEAVLYPEIDGLLERMAAAFADRPRSEPAIVSMMSAFDSVADEMARDHTHQAERFELLRRSGAGTTSLFVNARVEAAVAEMVRQRFAGDADVELRATLAARLVSTVMAVSTQQWLSGAGRGDVHDEARHCFDVLRELMG